MSAAGVRSDADQAPSHDAAPALGGIETDQVQGKLFEDGEVVGDTSGKDTHLIVDEDDTQAPVQTVLNGLLTNDRYQGFRTRTP